MCNAQLHLQTAYRNFFRILRLVSEVQVKKNPVRSYTTNCVNGNITLQNAETETSESRLDPHKKQHRTIDDRYILKGATVSQEADDKYYVSLLYAAEEAGT